MQTWVETAAHQLLECRGHDEGVKGFELALDPTMSASEMLQRMRDDSRLRDSLTEASFVLLPLPASTKSADLEGFAASLKGLGSAATICLVYDAADLPNAKQRARLNQLGFQFVLGGVGPHCNFLELTHNGVCGFSLEEGFVVQAAGDPTAASVLEAITGLAKNLGIRTFAQVRSNMVRDMAWRGGVDYVTTRDVEHQSKSSHH